MDRAWSRFRALALLAAASTIVHELRYAAAYGTDAGDALAETGHSYVPLLESLAVVLLAIALGRFCVSLLRARAGVVAEQSPPGFLRLWLTASASLAAVFTLQEALEGQIAAGHPAGLVGVFGNGGWTALLFAAALGAVVALLTRVAHRAIELVARRAPIQLRRPSTPWFARLFGRSRPQRLEVLAWKLAGRAPPAT